MEVAGYGIKEKTQAQSKLAKAFEELARDGYSVVPDVLDEPRLAAYRLALEKCYGAQVAEFGGADKLSAIKDANVVRLPLAYDDSFLQLAAHPTILELARGILGDSVVLLMQNGIINPAGEAHHQSNWHRDLNYQHWTSSRPLAVSALVCLDPFTAVNGATVALPGSHLVAAFPSDDYTLKNERQIIASAGSVIFMDGMVFHRAGANRSTGPRRAVNHVIGLPILSQQIDIPRSLGGKWSDDPFLSKYLGYRWNPKPSVLEWRQGKLQGLKG
jgi:ectoine hydroxylase-related dioxygenase (phytanoyl-CoA dioxygenase family)